MTNGLERAESALMRFEEELTIKELKHLFDRIQELLRYASNVDQLPNSSVDERSGVRDFKEYLTHKYQIVIRALQLKFRQRGMPRQHDDIGYGFNDFPSASDDELRAAIEKSRSQIESENELYEDVARAFKIGPDDRLWPSYRLLAISKELPTSPKAIEKQPKSTPPHQAFVPRPAQSADLKGPRQEDPTGAPQRLKPLPLDPAAHPYPSGAPSAITAAVASHKRLVGRPRHAATDEYKKFRAKYDKLSLLEVCQEFDKKKIPLPGKLSSFDRWIDAYRKNPQKAGEWLREQKRKPRAPRARGKLRRG